MKSEVHICLLIPVLNESENIDELIVRIETSLMDNNYLLVFIDDNSNDNTVSKINDYKLKNNRIILLEREKKRNGCERGGALYFALSEIASRYKVDVWIELDGDLSHQPEEITSGLCYMTSNQLDVLIVSKYHKNSITNNRGMIRSFISLFNSLLFRIAFSNKISDYSNGFRFYNIKAAHYILEQKIKYVTPIYLGEVLIHWLMGGFKIKETSGKYIGRKRGNSQVIWKDVLEGIKGYNYLIRLYYGKK